MAADNYQRNSRLVSAIKGIEQSKDMTIFFQMKIVEDSRSIASETSFPGTTFSANYQKTVCFHLMSSLLDETPKRPSLRMKVVEDLKLLYDRYRNLVSR